jgi:hypothetical protein
LNGNFQHALGRAQNLPQPLIELQIFRRDIELDLRDAVRIQVFARCDPRNGLRARWFGKCSHQVFLPDMVKGNSKGR